jgi:SAM-dependent methyltransferase
MAVQDLQSTAIADNADADLDALIFGDLQGARVVGMGVDVWDLREQIAPRLGTRGRFIGVHIDPAVIRDARQRNEAANGNGANVLFHEIDDDLRVSRPVADALVAKHAPSTLDALLHVERELARLRTEKPLIPDDSIDLVIATGLRLVPTPAARARLLKEFHRVVKRGGRIVVLDVASDEDVATRALLAADRANDGEIGRTIVREAHLLESLADAGFYGVTLVRRDASPWKVVDGADLRRVAAVAYKGKEGPCWEHYQAVMYRGPFHSVQDDDGHVYPRGQQIAVCKKTFEILSRAPYRGLFEYSEPVISVPAGMASPFPCGEGPLIRNPRDLKLRDPQPKAAPPPAHATNTSSNTPAPKRKSLVIFQRGASGSSGAEDLSRSLRTAYPDTLDVNTVDLDANPDATVPGQLRFRLSVSGDECLPAIAVDGVLMAVGGLPTVDQVEKLIAGGRAFGTLQISNLSSLAAQAPASTCCGPGCC